MDDYILGLEKRALQGDASAQLELGALFSYGARSEADRLHGMYW